MKYAGAESESVKCGKAFYLQVMAHEMTHLSVIFCEILEILIDQRETIAWLDTFDRKSDIVLSAICLLEYGFIFL